MSWRKPKDPSWTEHYRKDEDESPLEMHRRHAVKVKKPETVNNSIWGFLFVAAFWGVSLYAIHAKFSWAPPYEYYNISRWIFFFSIWLLIIFDAFQNNFLSGFVSLLVPPYTVIQGLMHADSTALRGIVLAIFLIMIAEFFLLGDRSMVIIMQVFFSDVVKDVNRILSREDW